MKLKLLTVLFTQLFITLEVNSQITQSEVFDVVTFSESDVITTSDIIQVPLLNKSERLSNKSATINKSYNDEIPVYVNKCIEYAAEIWSSYLKSDMTFNITFKYEPIDENIRTEVAYIKDSDYSIPFSLFRYKNSVITLDDYIPSDGTIVISSNVDWDYSVNECITVDKPNLTYGLLRSIGHILGFGSSVRINNYGEYYFSYRYHTLFESKIISSDSLRLTSISTNGCKPSLELYNFINQDNRQFLFKSNKNYYEFSKGPFDINNMPLSYINKGLMSSEFSTGNYILQVDSITQDILETLGWQFNKFQTVEIKCDEITDNGLCSAYKSHKFYIDTKFDLQEPLWRLKLPLKDSGDEVVILHDNNLSCIVPEIKDVDKYRIDINGTISCTLEFFGELNEHEIRALPYKIYMEVKPKILSAKILEIKSNLPYASYDAMYEVNYVGDEKLLVSVEEEYGSQLKSAFIYEPYYLTGIADHITAPYMAWINFTVKNKYGQDSYIIELEPYGKVNTQLNSTMSIDEAKGFTSIIIKDINGNIVSEIDNEEDLHLLSLKGPYILVYKNNNEYVKTTKIQL